MHLSLFSSLFEHFDLQYRIFLIFMVIISALLHTKKEYFKNRFNYTKNPFHCRQQEPGCGEIDCIRVRVFEPTALPSLVTLDELSGVLA